MKLENILSRNIYTEDGWNDLEKVFAFCCTISNQFSRDEFQELVRVFSTYYLETPAVLLGIVNNMK